MAEVKFVNTVKYRGVRYPAHTPFTVDDADIDSLVSKGAILISAPKVTGNPDAGGNPDEGVKDLDRMKIDELKAYASEKDIDITGLEKKSDILSAIKAFEASAK